MATPRCVALLGHPVGHSISPVMQEAAFASVGLPWRYIPFDVAPARFGAAVAALRTLDFVGANVTVPHKLDALRVANRIDASARDAGAANTLLFDDEQIIAYNTDVGGFSDAVTEAFGNALGGARVILIGAGGAARAALHACLAAGAARVVVLNRSLPRANSLIADVAAGATDLACDELTAACFARYLASATMVVQSTSVGMSPDVESVPVAWPAGDASHVALIDLVYNPSPTRFMHHAAAHGARVVGGLGMLVGQGARAFELWTGRAAPRNLMHSAAATALYAAR